jgi:hypothetical protein
LLILAIEGVVAVLIIGALYWLFDLLEMLLLKIGIRHQFLIVISFQLDERVSHNPQIRVSKFLNRENGVGSQLIVDF